MPLVDQPDFAYEDLSDLDLTCPACSANLILDDTFLTARVCGTCRRHFSMSARERIGLLADPGSFEEFVAPESIGPEGLAPELVPSAERLAEIEAIVNREIWRGAPVTYREMAYQEARSSGAFEARRRKQSLAWFRSAVERGLGQRLRANAEISRLESELGAAVERAEVTPRVAARRLLDRMP